jgi:hypothetical protein
LRTTEKKIEPLHYPAHQSRVQLKLDIVYEKSVPMPVKTSSETRAAIMAHHQHKLSGQKISDKMAELGMIVSKRTVNEIIREEKLKLQGIVKPPKHPGTRCSPSVRTKAANKIVRFFVDRPNSFTHSQISRQTGFSETTVRQIIDVDWKGQVRSKTKTHALSRFHARWSA